MKKWFVSGLIILFCAGLVQARPVSHKKAQAPKRTASRTQSVVVKEEPYKAYLVMDARNGQILEGENIHLKRAPASVVKLMVAYLVMEKLSRGEIKLTDPITVSGESSKIGGSQVYLKEGETFTLEELMKAILVASGNDASYAVAEHIAGTKEAFIQLMNQKAKALNMADTEFHSIHGLPPSKGETEDLSSCSDLAVLARELLKYPKILEWTSIKSEGFRNGQFIMNNHNKLLSRMPGADGLKTGYYRETGFNVVATALKNDLRLIVVVLGSSKARTRDDLALEKFRKAFAQYKLLDLVKKGETVEKEITLTDCEPGKIKGVAGSNISYSVPIDNKGIISKEAIVPSRIKGEIRQGQKLGDLIIKLDKVAVGKVDIVSPGTVSKAGFFKRVFRKLGINL
ncbi:MAG: D-alanyl-D-alanine carboxypeptidase [Deltaproteobacteria bacterium]|nr:D-alanyl-D-alanine carboxypeptidase [Deltaproteobacteria bacterium]